MIGEMFASDEQIVAITQDVWSSFTGTAIGSASEEVALDAGDVTFGRVAVTGPWQGCVLLACPTQLARNAASAMFDLPAEQLTDDEVADALGELTNMIAGNIKSLLPGPSRLSMPAVMVSASSTVRMPHAVLVNTVSLACEGLPLTVSIWQDLTGSGCQLPLDE
jgi:chemotaxis protein CheX